MPATVGVIGGGVGGTVVANRLARKAGEAAEITVFDEDARHRYQPAWLYVPTGDGQVPARERSERSLLRREVNLRTAVVERFDPSTREVRTADGSQRFDFLVLAAGSRAVPGEIEGLAPNGPSTDCWTEEGAARLRTALQTFEGGTIVTGATRLPFKCPPAPLELTFLLDEHLRRRGLRDRSEIHYVFPLERIYAAPKVAEKITPLLDERGISHHHPFALERVDRERRVLMSAEGDELPFDVLAVAPPHRGPEVAERSGIGDERGWVEVDPHTLELRTHEHVFVVGDAAKIDAPKAGAAAHLGGKVVADRIVALIAGRAPGPAYDGRVACFMETGYGRATFLTFTYDTPLDPPAPSRAWHLAKALMNRSYFSTLTRGWA